MNTTIIFHFYQIMKQLIYEAALFSQVLTANKIVYCNIDSDMTYISMKCARKRQRHSKQATTIRNPRETRILKRKHDSK